jgi:hypothetical protein
MVYFQNAFSRMILNVFFFFFITSRSRTYSPIAKKAEHPEGMIVRT